MMQRDLSGNRFGILGMGRSGIGAAGLINRLGGTALISDTNSTMQVSSAVAKLQAAGIEVETGCHDRLLTEPFDVIIVSPGATLKPEWIDNWTKRGTKLWSELELASQCYQGKWIGVTGSNGKTTTVTLLTDIFKKAGLRACAVGNIGTAWSECLPSTDIDLFVVEVSSFQMEHTHTARPNVCIILNILENHLDRHGDLETYGLLKLKLAANQLSADIVILNSDDNFLMLHASLPARTVFFGTKSDSEWVVTDNAIIHHREENSSTLLSASEWKLEGKHNLFNAAAAAGAASALGIDDIVIHDSLINANPVEHRIEFVKVVNSIRYVNDSKSTNLSATLTALTAIKGPITLLFGGRPKLESFAPIALLLGDTINYLVVFGEAQSKVAHDLGADARIHYCKNLEESFGIAKQLTRAGETILLSPGCASYDQFSNYEERGLLFKKLVMQL